jgi:hypothetical protein
MEQLPGQLSGLGRHTAFIGGTNNNGWEARSRTYSCYLDVSLSGCSIVIDSIPALAGFHRGVKIVFCFAFSLCVFYALVFTWAGIVFIYRKSAKKTNSVDGE